jgi:hypothetical protein
MTSADDRRIGLDETDAVDEAQTRETARLVEEFFREIDRRQFAISEIPQSE